MSRPLLKPGNDLLCQHLGSETLVPFVGIIDQLLIPSSCHTVRIQQHREQATRLADVILLVRKGHREKIPKDDGTNHKGETSRPSSETCQPLPYAVIESHHRHHDVQHRSSILDETHG